MLVSSIEVFSQYHAPLDAHFTETLKVVEKCFFFKKKKLMVKISFIENQYVTENKDFLNYTFQVYLHDSNISKFLICTTWTLILNRLVSVSIKVRKTAKIRN